MNDARDFERAVAQWLDDGSDATPPEVIDAVLLAVRSTPQQRDLRTSWRTTSMTSYLRVAAATAIVVLAGMASLYALGLGPNIGFDPTADPSPEPTTPSPAEAEVTELLNGFLAARVAGAGAQQYLAVPEEEIPLLYATTSGAHYERGEFEQVQGIEWPYGSTAFKVRLFAGDTVVEQLFFSGPDSPLLVGYEPDGFGTDIAPTTENGQPVAMPYSYFDGEVTLRAAHPWIMSDYSPSGPIFGRLIPEGPGVRPTTDGGERIDWDELFLRADPVLLEADCQAGPDPADAAGLAESIRSDPDLGASAPVAVSVGGADALMMDVKIAAGATVCVPATSGGDPLQNAVLEPLFTYEPGATFTFVEGRATKGPASGEWMRLYLFDVPDGLSMRILAIAIVAPESRFESVVELAAPVVDSVQFHAP